MNDERSQNIVRPTQSLPMKRLLATVCFVLILLSLPTWADSSGGTKAYNRGDYATAVKEFRAFAERGFANPQYLLGVMYENGQGVPKDNESAYRWYVEAAYQGHAQAQNNLGALYEEGHGVKQNYPIAVLWYQIAAEQGLAKAQFNLAEMYVNGRGVAINTDKARQWYYKAAAQGHKKSIAALQQWSVKQSNATVALYPSENAESPEKETSLEPDSRTDFEHTVNRCTKQVQKTVPSHQFDAYAEGPRVRYLGAPDAHFEFEKCMSKNGHPLTDR